MTEAIANIRREIEHAAEVAETEFDDLADYVWKSVGLIEHETRLELRKLTDYFPGRPDMQEFRWRHESRKLEGAFPFLIAQGNLLCASTLFEIRLLLLATTVEPIAARKLSAIRGQGVERCFAFFDAVGVAHGRLPNWEQVSAALTIRNCVVHSGGALQYSRDAERLRNIVKDRRFWTPEVRQRVRELVQSGRQERPDVTLFEHALLGERIVITNSYAHWVTSLFRDYFLNLCSSISATLRVDWPDDGNGTTPV